MSRVNLQKSCAEANHQGAAELIWLKRSFSVFIYCFRLFNRILSEAARSSRDMFIQTSEQTLITTGDSSGSPVTQFPSSPVPQFPCSPDPRFPSSLRRTSWTLPKARWGRIWEPAERRGADCVSDCSFDGPPTLLEDEPRWPGTHP